ncbi:phage portal protein [Lactiplantibacillus plantarum]|uniref:phage portal protein n=1 Tax=Lactiplantibacillus plantarum TaxID=1590 RepID=UPI00217CD5C6|nr:phage portal protein [Lactiplantibacillus plantarum]UWF32600.1 phage portal protein [Lactiplantibacillus plantarum]UWF37960.1 phage portal protein [Lactiplantibacillus plantarum]UWF40958.1 phage portal protein [Lactiplantibacillus plantarum]
MPFFEPPTAINNSVSIQSVPVEDDNIVNFLSPTGNNEYVSAKDALENSDIYSAINQISGDLATVQLMANMPRAQGILNNPSTTANGHTFWQSMYSQLLLGGECFAYRWRNPNGLDLRWEYLRPSQVQTYLLDDGSGLTYTVTFDEPNLGILQYVPQSDMIHIRWASTDGGMTGNSPLKALSNELQVKNSSNSLTLAALARSISAPGVLSIQHGGLLSEKMKASRSRNFMKQVNKSNGGPVVIDQLEDYKPLEMKADVTKLLSQTDWTSKQIAKVFGIPDSYLNGQGDQQSNIDQIKGMYTNALNHYLQAILAELDNKLNAKITANIRTAVDPLGDSFAATLSGLAKDGTIANNQATWLLQQTGYFPDEMPDAKNPTTQQVVIQSGKGGDNDDKESDD